MFSSDFPHEVNNEYCKHEIEEIIENDHLSDADKHAVLHGNAERFYGLKPLWDDPWDTRSIAQAGKRHFADGRAAVAADRAMLSIIDPHSAPR